MYRLLFATVLLLLAAVGSAAAQPAADSNWTESVRTVTLCKNGVELEAPVLTLGSSDQLLLRFDVMGPEADNYRWRIRHCDRRWQPDDLEPYDYISGFEEGAVDNYNTSFTTQTDYVNYYQYLPAAHSRLLASGNYLLEVFPQDHPDSTLFTRRFWVVENSLGVAAAVGKPYDNAAIFERQEVNVALGENLDYQGDLQPPSLNPDYLHVLVRQNGRTDNERELRFGGYDRQGLLYQNHPENIFDGGNTFRYFDISNIRTPMYNVQQIADYGGDWFAVLKPLEDRSRKRFDNETVLNGGMKVNVWDRDDKQTQADYVQVNFVLPRATPFLDGQVYVVGDLTQWKMDEQSRMQYDMTLGAYTLRLRLKQGYYAYQLLFLPMGQHVADTRTLEGDHYETPNNYYIFVYYRSPLDRYDRLAGYLKL